MPGKGALIEIVIHMLIRLFFAEEKFLNLTVERCQPILLVDVREVDAHVSSRSHYVELGIEDIDAINDSVEPGKRERCMTFVLPDSIIAAETNKSKIQSSTLPDMSNLSVQHHFPFSRAFRKK